jgi:DNA-binding transcriptional LysR family regulator
MAPKTKRALEGVTIEQLRTVRAVASAGSFSGAARALGRVQAAVSQSIDRLEAQLGVKVFDRSGRLPRLTPHGEAIVLAAAKVEAGVDDLEDLVAALRRGAETTLSVVVDVLFPTAALVAFATEFAAAHPSVELLLFTDVLSAVTAHVREKQSTWGIAVEDADLAGLDHRRIGAVLLVPVAAPSHPLARRETPLDAAALGEEVQIVLGEHRRDEGRAHDTQGVFSPRTWRVVDLATKHALIAGGLGWGHMPEHLVRDDLRQGRLAPLRLEAWGSAALRRELALAWRRGTVMGPVARWAHERLSQLCRGAAAPAHHAR